MRSAPQCVPHGRHFLSLVATVAALAGCFASRPSRTSASCQRIPQTDTAARVPVRRSARAADSLKLTVRVHDASRATLDHTVVMVRDEREAAWRWGGGGAPDTVRIGPILSNTVPLSAGEYIVLIKKVGYMPRLTNVHLDAASAVHLDVPLELFHGLDCPLSVLATPA